MGSLEKGGCNQSLFGSSRSWRTWTHSKRFAHCQLGWFLYLFIASNHQWCVKTTDIESAFLQGQPLQRDDYIDLPNEARVKDGKIWYLNTCLYELNDTARQFYLSVNEAQLKLTCTQANLDPEIFCYYQDNKLSGTLACHVEDFLHAGNSQFEDNIMAPLWSCF